MIPSLEATERAARRALEEDDTVPELRRELDPALFLLIEPVLADDRRIRHAQLRVRLDHVRDRASGPYVVNGQSIRARPAFRKAGTIDAAIGSVIGRIGRAAGIPPLRIQHLHWGQGLPTDLVTLTQALLDAGRLPLGPGDLADRIRQLQRQSGIGFDGAGYARELLRGALGRDPGCYGPGLETFRDLDEKRSDRFERVSLADAGPGDLILLEEARSPSNGTDLESRPERLPVVIYRAEPADDAKLDGLRARGMTLPPRPSRVFEVDGCFRAASAGIAACGVRRDTWIDDEEANVWSLGAGARPPGSFVASSAPFGARPGRAPFGPSVGLASAPLLRVYRARFDLDRACHQNSGTGGIKTS